MNISKKLAIQIIIITATLVLLMLFTSKYFFSKVSVYFELNNVSELHLYKSPSGGDPDEILKKSPDKIITKTGGQKIPKGYYIYKAQPATNEYETLRGSFNTAEDNILKIQPNYSNEKLKSLYASEINAIQLALNTKYPNQMKDYKIDYGKLYIDGSWFAGYLIPNNGSDNLQVVLHKKGELWEVVATPNITISKAQYPKIPYQVIESVNIRPF